MRFQNLAASSVQKLILFYDVMIIYSKTKSYLYLKKNVKKAQGIIFHGVKTGQCMSHVSTKNKTKHED